ncbi:MAG TPA: hypothetical protein VNA15_12275, partial [Candidatus Angelobacter sp.]|nr:hypothetical protein [Candidatus Angelobacter sp.]
ARLENHWAQTYGVIAIISNAFIGLSALVIVPRILAIGDSAYIILGVLSAFILAEYSIFTRIVHRKTVELYNSAPCQVKLTILRVHMKRKLLTQITFATNFAFSIFALLGASIALLTAGLPYYIAVNAGFLLGFKLNNQQELDAVFEAVPQLRRLPEFYQTMSIRFLKDRIKSKLKQQVPIAGEINPDPFLRIFYLENLLPQQPSAQATQRVADLKSELTNGTDLMGVLNQVTPSSAGTEAVKFLLPWEKRFNWTKFGIVSFSILQAVAALYTLQVFGFISAFLKFVHLA